MTTTHIAHTASDRLVSWLETEYCASGGKHARAQRILEDAMLPPALTAWREHASHTKVLGEMVGTA